MGFVIQLLFKSVARSFRYCVAYIVYHSWSHLYVTFHLRSLTGPRLPPSEFTSLSSTTYTIHKENTYTQRVINSKFVNRVKNALKDGWVVNKLTVRATLKC